MEPFIGQILAVGFNFAPKGWAFCNGAMLSIAQNSALFSLLGTTYGGDGINTFALPNLQSRIPVGMVTNPSTLGGLAAIQIGERAGVQNTTLLPSNLPSHTHLATGSVAPQASSVNGSQTSPGGGIPAIGTVTLQDGSTAPVSAYSSAHTTNMAPSNVTVTVQPTGNNQPLPIQNPYLGVNFIIALQGVYPSRS